MLFRSDAVFQLQRVRLDLAANPLALVRIVVEADQIHVARPLLLNVAADRKVGIGHRLVAQPHRSSCVEQRPIHALRVELHEELPTGIIPAPFVIRTTVGGQHLVGVLAVSVLNCDAVGREQARLLGRQPEQIDHVELCNRVGGRIHARTVHLLVGDPRIVMFHGIPLAAGCGVGRQHLLVGEQLLLVRLEELPVDLPRLLRSDVAARESPVLMQHLLLEPAEGRLDALRRAVVRRRRPIDAADVREELLRDLAPLAALIVGDDLVGFAAGRLDGHAEGGELRVEVLAGADRVAEQRFAVSVDDLIDRNRADDGLAVFDRLVEQVELRAVAVPQRIAHGRHFGLVAAGVELLGRQLAVDGVVPQRLDLRPFEVLNQRRLRGERLPSAALGDAVELLEELLGRVDRDAAAAQGDDLPACRFGNLQRIRVAELTRHEADIALLAVLSEFVAQAGFALRERVPVGIAQLLGSGKDIRPDHGRVVAVGSAHRLLCFEHIPQGIQHPCIQRVFLLLLLWQMLAVRKQVVVVESPSLRIGSKRHFILFHRLLRITVFFLEADTEAFR